MKTWKLLALTALTSTFFGCGGGGSTEGGGGNGGAACAKAPKLTKTCLEGEWLADASLATKLTSFFVNDSSYLSSTLPSEVIYTPGAYLKLTFRSSKATIKDMNALDTAKFELFDGAYSIYAKGTFTLSADSSVILFDMQKSDILITGNKTAKIFKDSEGEALSFGASSSPFFGNSIVTGAKTAEIFYRAF